MLLKVSWISLPSTWSLFKKQWHTGEGVISVLEPTTSSHGKTTSVRLAHLVHLWEEKVSGIIWFHLNPTPYSVFLEKLKNWKMNRLHLELYRVSPGPKANALTTMLPRSTFFNLNQISWLVSFDVEKLHFRKQCCEKRGNKYFYLIWSISPLDMKKSADFFLQRFATDNLCLSIQNQSTKIKFDGKY